MSQLLKAIQVNKKEKEEKEKDAEQPSSVDQLVSDMEKATISTAAQCRHSYLHHQPRSISGICLSVCLSVYLFYDQMFL